MMVFSSLLLLVAVVMSVIANVVLVANAAKVVALLSKGR